MDETVLREPYREAPSPSVRVRVEDGPEQTFTAPFTIGRGGEATLQVEAGSASREHVEVSPDGDGWILRDLGSTNGVYMGDERIKKTDLKGHVTVQLGRTGPHIHFLVGEAIAQAEEAERPEEGVSEDKEQKDLSTESRVMEHYFGGGSGRPMGERTQMIRKAYVKVQRKEKRKYGTLIGIALVLLVVALSVVVWQRMRLAELQRQAEAIFYEMKGQDLAIAQFRLAVIDARGSSFISTDSTGAQSDSVGTEESRRWEAGAAGIEQQLARLEDRRRITEEQYDGFVEQSGVYRGLSPEEVEIYKVARIFNESEFTIPAGFVAAVQQYIGYWQGSSRFRQAIRRAQDNGYIPVIVDTFERYGLPPEFFYLGLQESNFNECAVGPPTRYGYAKGMWQFIPDTGRRYGLVTGPLVADGARVCDPGDDRHNYIKAADASAHYILDIYTQLAEASGLLAMASYNWGEHRIIPKLPRLEGLHQGDTQEEVYTGIPQNPQQRSYWRFLNEYKDRMPQQTKDYVLYIFSAAVIGQNPRLFGFDMDNPLEPYMARLATPTDS